MANSQMTVPQQMKNPQVAGPQTWGSGSVILGEELRAVEHKSSGKSKEDSS